MTKTTVDNVPGSPVTGPADPDQVFLELRADLVRQATRTVGSPTEAEDVVQEVWLRWRRNHPQVESAPGWLRTVTRNLALDRVRAVAARRESVLDNDLVLPATHADLRGAENTAEIARGMRVVLGSLSSLERVVFVLREALEWSFADIARVTGRSAEAVRQLQVRARRHIAAAPDRFEVPAQTLAEVAETFATIGSGGDVTALLDVLAPEVALVAPGMRDLGGRVVHDVAGIAVMSADGRLLLCHRSSAAEWYPDVWDVAGSHLLPGEPPAACAVRAARKELRISVREPRLLGQYEGDAFRMSMFVASSWEGRPSNMPVGGHDAVRFFSREEASSLELADDRYLDLFDHVA